LRALTGVALARSAAKTPKTIHSNLSITELLYEFSIRNMRHLLEAYALDFTLLPLRKHRPEVLHSISVRAEDASDNDVVVCIGRVLL
jgi:hypothetical protein